MRRDWDDRARTDAFHYIASWRKDWDEASFFASGNEDCVRLVDPILQKLQFDPASKTMAELGCGAGRMTHSFAQRFQSVTGVDISEEMQSRAKRFLESDTNIRWVLSNGETLAELSSDSMDFVFSYLVLQHMPSKALFYRAVNEMIRVLRPGGIFLFQFNGSYQHTMNWKGRAISSVLDGLASLGLRAASRRIASIAGIDPEMVGKTWRGAALTSAEIGDAVRSAQAEPIEFPGAGTPMAWCYGRKLPEARE